MRIMILAAVALALAAPAQAKVVIAIDKSTQRMTVTVDGTQRWIWPVSTGRRGRATPAGSFQAFRLEKDHYSKEWDDAPMPHSIFFTKRGHAIHGSYDIKRLGTPASAGCVRLHPDNAATLFALVQARGVLNATVVISGEEPRGAPAVAKQAPGGAPNRAAQRPPQERTSRPLPPYQPQPNYPPAHQRPSPGYYTPPPPPPGYMYAPPPPAYYYYR